VSKPPREPYSPDPEDDAEPIRDFAGELVDATVLDADWANIKAFRFSAQRTMFTRCRLTGAELGEASLQDVTFADCRVDLAGLRAARLERVSFRDCRLGESELTNAKLKDVLFENCELREATFSGARLERVELRGCDLTNLRGVEALRGARMLWNDAIEAAPLFATALGIELVD
jgi:uncharacterized protein YjbI with pentapeptide repeats